MDKNLNWKLGFVLFLVAMAALAVRDPRQTIKKGIDLNGGYSLMYRVDASGMEDSEKQGLAGRMIRVQRKRIDPANQLNLIWRAHGNDIIEILMPEATGNTTELREVYQAARKAVVGSNINMSQLNKILDMEKAARDEEIAKLIANNPDTKTILEELVTAKEAKDVQNAQLDAASEKSAALKKTLEDLKVSLSSVDSLSKRWATVPEDQQAKEIATIVEAADKAAKAKKPGQSDEEVKANAGLTDQQKTEMTARIKEYVQAKVEYFKVNSNINEIDATYATAQTAVKDHYVNLTLFEKQLDSKKKATRDEAIRALKEAHPSLATKVDDLVAAYESYKQVRGQMDDPEDLKRKLRGAGVLEFRILPAQTEIGQDKLKDYQTRLADAGPAVAGDSEYQWFKIRDPQNFRAAAIRGQFGDDSYVLALNKPGKTLLKDNEANTWKLTRAYPTSDSLGKPAIGFEFNEIGAGKFAKLTNANKDLPLCILLDGEAISAPNINSTISKSGIIQGSFSMREVNDMCDKLNAGSLPARMGELIDMDVVDSTLGAENLNSGFSAAGIGMVVVFLFMVIYYMLPGGLAGIALILNLLFLLATMAFTRATLTMPGIAGIILTVGMAVDANVLIFERIREEQNRGSTVAQAIRNGYSRAFWTIFDANLTTFIVAMILFKVASEEVKGFALTLMIGIVCSMFTALYVTRLIFEYMLQHDKLKHKLGMMQLIKTPNLKWMNMRYAFWVVSVAMVIAGWVFFLSAEDKYSIEFTGGTKVQFQLKQDFRTDKSQELSLAVEAALEKRAEELGEPIQFEVQGKGQESELRFALETTATNQAIFELELSNKDLNAEAVKDSIIKAAKDAADGRLKQTTVTGENGKFKVTTQQTNAVRFEQALKNAFGKDKFVMVNVNIEDKVTEIIRQVFAGNLAVINKLNIASVEAKVIDDELIKAKSYLADFKGGFMFDCKLAADNIETIEGFTKRLTQVSVNTEYSDLDHNNAYQIFGVDNKSGADDNVTEFEYAVRSETLVAGYSSQDELDKFQTNEDARIKAALELQTTFESLTQIDPTIGGKSKTDAMVAIVFSLLAIIAYIWLRFGNFRFGLAACVALAHDVSIALGAVALMHTMFGGYKIDVPMIAGFLTIIGYSLNDTIVIFDRIRENRGKQVTLNSGIINNSINQSLSRTVITSVTTLLVLVIMFFSGATTLKGFSFALIVGVIVGTYSSVAIASPLLYGARDEQPKEEEVPVEAGPEMP
ncbi:MAG: protein translocase subunit SecD [Phycisphaerae bacterium]|nr:protein translocase subunit SecD [Phycisphaerae bacterium]